ncbi:phosphoribosylamine--glycine ligase [Patescibacteria group bacterium]|nr:phosphoribosylamine--glycine ligase [Patescibacteria group bacterium]
MKKIAVLISNKGTGTNLQAIINGVKSGEIKAEIAVVISDTSEALGLSRARKNKIPIKIVPKKEDLLPVLKKLNLDFVCLAGWKQIILDEVITAFPNKILNLHPGFIPDSIKGKVLNPDGNEGLWNKGKLANQAIQNFLDSKSTYAGSSIHYLTLEFDFGPVLARVFEKIKPEDNIDSLYARLKVKENKMYTDVLAELSVSKTVMVIDGGGRGAALVDKYTQSDKVGKILAVPGNDLMSVNCKKTVVTFQHLKTTSIAEILQICKKEKVDLVDVAQDNAVEAGLVDKLTKAGIKAFGPTKAAGQIEWDKSWARNFMVKYKIPTPEFHVFKSEDKGIDFVKKDPDKQWFVKASGLAEGKGAISAKNTSETIDAIKQMSKFGISGKTYLLEEWLIGEEFSAFALCDGEDFQIVGFAQDHKRVNDGDKGPNTGGMGCVSNPKVISAECRVQSADIFKKTINGLRKEGRPYKGVLYLGGIIVKGKVWVIEFNARWGDPEAQVLLPSIKNDLYEICLAIISGNIKKTKIIIDKKVRVAVALCAKGYPIDYSKAKGKLVYGIEKAAVKIYGAGIKKIDGSYVVSGGRVLYVVGEGDNVIDARRAAYSAISEIKIQGNHMHYRRDIGWRDINR